MNENFIELLVKFDKLPARSACSQCGRDVGRTMYGVQIEEQKTQWKSFRMTYKSENPKDNSHNRDL